MHIIASIIKELRAEKGISQETLSRKVNISISNIRSWEQGINVPHIDMIIKLAEFFNVTVGQMVGTEKL